MKYFVIELNSQMNGLSNDLMNNKKQFQIKLPLTVTKTKNE